MQDSRSREKKKSDRIAEHWEVIIRNLPEHFNKEDMTHFLYKTLESCRGLIKPGNPVQSTFIDRSSVPCINPKKVISSFLTSEAMNKQ